MKLLIKDAVFEEKDTINVYIAQYVQGGNYCIRSSCFDPEMGIEEPYMVHTVNIPNMLEKNEVAIKEYNEGIGSLAFLYAWDIIDKPHKALSSGHINYIPVCRLLIDPEDFKVKENISE